MPYCVNSYFLLELLSLFFVQGTVTALDFAVFANDPSYAIPELFTSHDTLFVLSHLIWIIGISFVNSTLNRNCLGRNQIVTCDHADLDACHLAFEHGFRDVLPQDVLDSQDGNQHEVIFLHLVDVVFITGLEVLVPMKVFVGQS